MLEMINVTTSAIMHLLALSNMLYTKLKFKERIIIFIIYITNFVVGIFIFGQIMVVSAILMNIIYFMLLKKNFLQRSCLVLFSYILCAVIANIVSLALDMFGISSTEIMGNYKTILINVGVSTSMVYLISFIIGKVLRKFIDRIQLPIKIWIILLINLLITVIVFLFNVLIGEKIGYSREIIFFNCILFALFATVSITSILLLFRAELVEMETKMKQDSFDNLQDYTEKIEKMYADVRAFKHDYINIMISMKSYIENDEMGKLHQYFINNIEPLGQQIMTSKIKLNQLMHIQAIEIKSILSSKIIFASELGIDVNLEILEPVDIRGIDTIELIRILGIFLDNAIEAVQETEVPQIGISIINNNSSVAIIIKNNYQVQDIAYYNLGSAEISNKGANRGVGLYNVKTILSNYNNILLETSYNGQYFEQHLEIMAKKSKKE